MTDHEEIFGSQPGKWRRPPPPRAPLKLPKGRNLLLVVGAAFLGVLLFTIFVTRRGGIVEIADTEVAVIVNYLSGNKKLVTTPGYKIFLPVVEQAFLFDKSPNKFVMEGDRHLDANHVSKLTVRANDGSNFWFETLEIQYQLIADLAPVVLYDSGPGDAFKKHWVRTFARSVLRDEFGRYSAVEMADPTTFRAATPRAQERLNELLRPHGLEIIQIITPKPKFEDRYEQAIEDRKVADQVVEKLKTREEQLQKERERRLADVERDMATEYEQLLGTLEADRIQAEREAVRVSKDADAYKIAQVALGEAQRERMLQEAGALEQRARKEAEGLHARVEALAARGDVLVREKLAEKLRAIRFEVIPYRRDPAPLRIEHLGAVAPAPAAAPAGGGR